MYSLSVVIPTFNRGNVLLDTIGYLLDQDDCADEIIVVDQTQYDDDSDLKKSLIDLEQKKVIRWVQREQPSIPKAMNHGLLLANSDYVLFLDDDVLFSNDFIHQHRQALIKHKSIGHVGQIVQPWQEPIDLKNYNPGKGLNRDLSFPFHCKQSHQVNNCMAGNLCVKRDVAIAAGGFDQRFNQTAYRFESEFSKRMCRHTRKLLSFEPQATLNHLHVNSGGTRSHGDFFTSITPIHSACNYYFALQEGSFTEAFEYILRRFIKSIADKFYLRKPWWIPVRIIAEVRGFFWAMSMYRKGPIYIDSESLDSGSVK